MAFYLHKVHGALVSGQPWSTGITTSASISEAAANTAWAAAWTTLFGTAGFNALYKTSLTVTSATTSTASATFRQTTMTRANLALAGLAATGELPDFAALLITLRSTAATKYGRGRMYLPAPVAAALSGGTGGHLLPASATAIATAMSAFFVQLVTAGLSPVLVTRRPTAGGVPQYSTRAITTGDMPNVLAVQQRRGEKIVPSRTTITI